MDKNLLERASKIDAHIKLLQNEIRDLRKCNHTLGVVHWQNYSVSYHTYIEVSDSIISAIIDEKLSRIKQLEELLETL